VTSALCRPFFAIGYAPALRSRTGHSRSWTRLLKAVIRCEVQPVAASAHRHGNEDLFTCNYEMLSSRLTGSEGKTMRKLIWLFVFVVFFPLSASASCPSGLNGMFLPDGSFGYFDCVNDVPILKFEKLPRLAQPSTGQCTRMKIFVDRADGCSGGVSSDKRRFRAACNEHDVCYATPGKTQKGCDEDFLANMRYMCEFEQGGCRGAAFFIRGFVAFATKSYNNGQDYVARKCAP
jgi:hypothetical protein